MSPTFRDGVFFGHYVVDGECVACGHKVDDLERFTFVIPPPELYWDEIDLERLPEALKRLIGRMD